MFTFKEYIRERLMVDDNTKDVLLYNLKYRLNELKHEIIHTHYVDVDVLYNDYINEFGEDFLSQYRVLDFFEDLKKTLKTHRLDNRSINILFNQFMSNVLR